MTQRDRQAAVGLAPRPAPEPPRAGTAPAVDRPAFSWEDLYHSLPPARQQELLKLAEHQGILYAHQLPAADQVSGRRQWLAQLAAGKIRDLPAFTPESTAADETLDAAQREAVAQALATPDFCLIQGLPGSGKSRVAAAIAAQAATRGQRVLLLAAHESALDRVLEQVADRDSVLAVRCVAAGSNGTARVPPSIRPFTFDERVRRLRDESLRSAEASACELERQLGARRAEQSKWIQLQALAETHVSAQEKLRGVLQRQADLVEAVHVAWDAVASEQSQGMFEIAVASCRASRGEKLRQLEHEQRNVADRDKAISEEKAGLVSERDRLAPLARARQKGRWWTPAWWKALFRPGAVARFQEVAARLEAIAVEENAQSLRTEGLRRERQTVEEEYKVHRQQIIDAEIERRRSLLATEEQQARTDIAQLERQWAQAGAPSPVAQPEQVADQRQEWSKRLQELEAQAAFARRWADCLVEAVAALPARLPAMANLVAATPVALANDPHFADPERSFDLLLVDEADQVPEADFLAAARRATRWVLIGDSQQDPPRTSRLRNTAVRPPLFHRLWHQWHVAPRQLPFCWTLADGKLCCRLRTVREEDRRWIECEPLVDRPDIELCILAAPRAEPVLVEVRFPSGTPVTEAKALIFRELQEVPAQAHGESFLWSEDPSVIRVQLSSGTICTTCMPAPEAGSTLVVALADGVREYVRAGTACRMPSFDTLRFEFDRQAGWTRQGAAEWLSRHLGACDTGRTVFLGTPHRLQPALGHAILDLLGLCSEPSTNGCSRTPAIRFIPVPGPEGDRRRSRDGRRPAEPHRVAGPRGAGFEVNLGAPGHGEPLPADIRVSLQSRGLVNYPEALAVVQTLEELLADSVFLAEATAWQQHNGRGEPATLFVTALHAAQVELLRAVLTRSRNLLRAGLQNRGDGQFRLSGSVPLEIRVETPSALRHRDCVALLLSMTRSHSHRAVALAEEAAWLPLALTRASSRLILFGDTGTLLRRTQWRGAVDHLDEFAAERERELAIRLVERVLGLELPPAPIPPTAAARR